MSADTLIHFFVALMVVVNPIAALPIFMSLTSDYSEKQQRHTSMMIGVSIGSILLTAAIVGLPLLSFFGISMGGFEAAGGLIILLMGLSMLSSQQSAINHTAAEHQQAMAKKESVALVPMALPVMAGPAAISTVIIRVSNAHGIVDYMLIFSVIIIIALISYVTLFFADKISAFVGDAGLKVIVRIMGIILSAIAIGMLAEGLRLLFPILA